MRAAAAAVARATAMMAAIAAALRLTAMPEPMPLVSPCMLISRGAIRSPATVPTVTPARARIIVLVTSVAPLSRLSQARLPTSAACPRDAASRRAVLIPLLPVPRRSLQRGISRQDAWPAACACTRTVSRR